MEVGLLSVGCEVFSSKTVSESSEVIVGADDGGPEGAFSCDGAWLADCEAILALVVLAAVGGRAGSSRSSISLLSQPNWA